MMFRNILSTALVLILSTVTLLPVSAQSKLALYVQDSVAGTDVTISSSRMTAGSDALLRLMQPLGSTLSYQLKANADGVVNTTVNGFHTRQAGVYQAILQTASSSVTQQFEVFADRPSMSTSTVETSKAMVQTGAKDSAHLTVTLRDAYNNPVKNHELRVISSRSSDVIQATSDGKTNDQGKASFVVMSSEEGISTYTVIDSTTNDILSERAEVVYSSDGYGNSIGGMFSSSLLAQATSTTQVASELELSIDAASPLKVGDVFNITIKALTSTKQPAIDYRGTIDLTSNDDTATLPLQISDYTFTGAELPAATKIYSLAGSFATPGTKTIEVRDIDNPSLKDEITIEVIDPTGPSVADTTITLTSPQAGILTSKQVVVSGQTRAGIQLQVKDNGLEIASVFADNNGRFETIISNLTDGTHTLTVEWEDTNGNTLVSSDAVQFSLQSSGPEVQSVTYDPVKPTYEPGERVTVLVQSEPSLSSVTYAINGRMLTLQETEVAGVYGAVLLLPTTPGAYDVNVTLTNNLGISTTEALPDHITLKGPSFDMQSVVYTLKDNATIEASWLTPADQATIGSYRINFGTSKTDLTGVQSMTLSQTSASFSALLPDTTYYFQFHVLDSSGAILQSDTVKSVTTPKQLAIKDITIESLENALKVTWVTEGLSSEVLRYRVMYGISSENYIRDEFTSESTITLQALVPESTHYIRIQVQDATGATLMQSSEVSGSPLGAVKDAAAESCFDATISGLQTTVISGERYISWNPIEGNIGYLVQVTSSTGAFAPQVIEVTQNRLLVSKLPVSDDDVQVRIQAKCSGGDALWSNALKVQTGPMIWALLILSVVLSYAATAMRRYARAL